MNISSEISSIYESNSSYYFFSNGTEVDTDLNLSPEHYMGLCISSILLSFPINSYVFWLIVTGTGNGLVAEFFFLSFSVCEIIFSMESFFMCFTSIFEFLWTIVAFIDGLHATGRPLFECLICVERYLAVVHPIIFLKFKPLRYRLMCSAVVWVTTFASGGFYTVIFLFFRTLYKFIAIGTFLVFLSIQLFCCVAVLRALKQSGPGEREREREEENPMKKRAFIVILITTVSTFIIYIPYIAILCVPNIYVNVYNATILMHICQYSYVLAGLVQPVFFLYRVGRLNFIKCQ